MTDFEWHDASPSELRWGIHAKADMPELDVQVTVKEFETRFGRAVYSACITDWLETGPPRQAIAEAKRDAMPMARAVVGGLVKALGGSVT